MTSEHDLDQQARKILIAQGHYPDLSKRSQDLMRYACRGGNSEVVAGYLGLGMSTEIRDDWSKSTPLLTAVEGNHLDIVRMLVEAGADLDARDRDGDTPLHTAINWNHQEIAEFLVSVGSPIDTLSEKDESPLGSALEKGCDWAVSLLLDAGADPDFCHDDKPAPIFIAAEHAPQMLPVLVDAGASIEARKPFHGNTLLMEAATDGRSELVEMLVEAGADKSARNDFGWTASMIARFENQHAVAALLEVESDDMWGDREFALLRGAENGDFAGLAAYLEGGGDPDLRRHTGQTLLMFAAGAGDRSGLDVVRLLIDHGASVDLVAQFGTTALSSAADVEVVDVLLEAGASPDEREGHSEALLRTCYKKQPEVVGRLLEAGASVDSRDAFGQTALLNAVSGGSLETLDVLLAAGANTALKNHLGDDALGYAVEWGKREAVERLIAAGADLDATNHSHETPLHRICKKHYTGVDESVYVDIGRILLEAGADCTKISFLGQTPVATARFSDNSNALALVSDFLTVERLRTTCDELGLADDELGLADDERPAKLYEALASTETAETLCEWIRRGERDVALGLVEAGVVDHIAPRPNIDPVRCAAACADAELVRALLEHGAPGELVSQYSQSPMSAAVCNGYMECLEALIDAGADIEARIDNRPLVVVAAGSNQHAVVQRLVEAGADLDPLPAGASALIGAAQGDSLEFVTWLIERGVKIDVRETNGRTALHHAVAKGRADFVETLLDAGADIDLTDNEAMTPLHIGAKEGRAEIVRILLEAGADFRKIDTTGATALDYATGREDVTKVFEELAPESKGAKSLELDALVDEGEWSKLLDAVYRGDEHEVAALLADGADPNETNYLGDSLVTIAAKRGSTAIIRALCAAGADVAHIGPSGYGAYSVALTDSGPADLKDVLEELGASIAMSAIEGQVKIMQAQTDFFGALSRGELIGVARVLDDQALDIHLLSNGSTPLGTAIGKRDAEMVELLLAKGANPRVPHWNQSLLEHALGSGDEKIISLVRDALEGLK